LGTTFGDAGDAAGLVASVDFIEAELLVTLLSASLSAAPKVTASRKEPAPKPASAAAATTSKPPPKDPIQASFPDALLFLWPGAPSYAACAPLW
jgi:hypothetical protein